MDELGDLARDFNALAYVLAGRGYAGDEGRPLDEGQMAVFGPGAAISVRAADAQPVAARNGWEVLLLGGLPIREQVAAAVEQVSLPTCPTMFTLRVEVLLILAALVRNPVAEADQVTKVNQLRVLVLLPVPRVRQVQPRQVAERRKPSAAERKRTAVSNKVNVFFSFPILNLDLD